MFFPCSTNMSVWHILHTYKQNKIFDSLTLFATKSDTLSHSSDLFKRPMIEDKRYILRICSWQTVTASYTVLICFCDLWWRTKDSSILVKESVLHSSDLFMRPTMEDKRYIPCICSWQKVTASYTVLICDLWHILCIFSWQWVTASYTVFICSCDLWWKTNDIFFVSQALFNILSTSPFLSAQWCQCKRSLLQSVSSGGGLTWMLLTHRRHLNL